MRSPKLIALSAITLLCLTACKKQTTPILPLSAITIVNAMPTSNPIVNMFGNKDGQFFFNLLKVYYGNAQSYSQPPAANSLLVRPFTDTTFSIFDGKLTLSAGGIYTFCLAGDTTHPDTLLIKDNIPRIIDSTAGVRFINLSIGGKSLSINLAGNDPTTNQEFSNLGYLQASSFKTYSAKTSDPGSYDLEIRDQASGDLLATFTWSYSLFKSNTIIVTGSTDPASSTPLNVFVINNY